MPKLEISTPKSEDGQPSAAWGTLVKVDGRELPHVRSLAVRFNVDDVVTAEATLLVTDDFAYEADAAVNISLEVAP